MGWPSLNGTNNASYQVSKDVWNAIPSTITGTANQITVTGGANASIANVTISLPQNVTLGNLTVTGNITGNVTGNISGNQSIGNLTISGILTISSATASRAAIFNATKAVVSSNATQDDLDALHNRGNITGSANQIIVGGDSAVTLGNVTLNLPQNIDTAADVNFRNANLSSNLTIQGIVENSTWSAPYDFTSPTDGNIVTDLATYANIYYLDLDSNDISTDFYANYLAGNLFYIYVNDDNYFGAVVDNVFDNLFGYLVVQFSSPVIVGIPNSGACTITAQIGGGFPLIPGVNGRLHPYNAPLPYLRDVTSPIQAQLNYINQTKSENITLGASRLYGNATGTPGNITLGSSLRFSGSTLDLANNITIGNNLTASNLTISNNASALNLALTNNLSGVNGTFSNNLTASGNLSVTRNGTLGNATISNNLTANNLTVSNNGSASNLTISNNATANNGTISNNLTVNNYLFIGNTGQLSPNSSNAKFFPDGSALFCNNSFGIRPDGSFYASEGGLFNVDPIGSITAAWDGIFSNNLAANNLTLTNNLTTVNTTVSNNGTANNATISNNFTTVNATISNNFTTNNSTVSNNLTVSGNTTLTRRINWQNGTTYTLAVSDFNVNSLLVFGNQTLDMNCTVPSNANVALPLAGWCNYAKYNNQTIKFIAQSGQVIFTMSSNMTTTYGLSGTAVQLLANTWAFHGSMS